jgi:hypothetical protein
VDVFAGKKSDRWAGFSDLAQSAVKETLPSEFPFSFGGFAVLTPLFLRAFLSGGLLDPFRRPRRRELAVWLYWVAVAVERGKTNRCCTATKIHELIVKKDRGYLRR